jgi:hypothetical protein
MNGEVKADARLADLAATTAAVLVLQRETKGLDRALKGLDGVGQIETMHTPEGYPAYRVVGQDQTDLCPAIYDLARKENWPLRELRRDVRTLETVFNQLATAG